MMVIMKPNICVSSDKSVVNQTGRLLLEKCIDNQLCILNERSLGDLLGHFTSHTPRCSSTVHYLIDSRTLSNCIHKMNVHDLYIF